MFYSFVFDINWLFIDDVRLSLDQKWQQLVTSLSNNVKKSSPLKTFKKEESASTTLKKKTEIIQFKVCVELCHSLKSHFPGNEYFKVRCQQYKKLLIDKVNYLKMESLENVLKNSSNLQRDGWKVINTNRNSYFVNVVRDLKVKMAIAPAIFR